MNSNRSNDLTNALLNHTVSASGTGNTILSPISIRTLLSLLADSTSGDTREQIIRLLGRANAQTGFTTKGSLISANAVCVNRAIRGSINPDYKTRLSDYDAELFVSENIVADVNDWVADKTKNMITNIADDTVTEMQACFLNAVAFDGEWETEYEEYDIRPDIFHNADHTMADVQMMSSVEQLYVETDFITGFVKPYKDNEFSFLALLPRKRGTRFMELILEKTDMTELFNSVSHAEVRAEIPEFCCDYMMELRHVLSELGITSLFADEADFSPMTLENIKVDSIKHKIHIEVDRKGTKAAAVTESIAVPGCAPEHGEVKTVKIDRPFIFAVMHNDTGTPAFVGVVNDL